MPPTHRLGNLLQAGSVVVAVASLATAVRGAPSPRVGLLIAGALALCLAGIALEAIADSPPPPDLLPSLGGRAAPAAQVFRRTRCCGATRARRCAGCAGGWG